MASLVPQSPASAHPLLGNPLYQALLTVAPQPAPVAQRFIVLIPDQSTHEMQLARALWTLSPLHPTPLLLITLVADETRALRARRRLATLATLTRDEQHPVETRLVTGNWLIAIRSLWLPGDVVVCHAEQRLSHWRHQPLLAQRLITRHRIPIYLLKGFYPKLATPALPDWVRTTIFDVVAALVLGLFLLLQIAIQHLDPFWLRQGLLCLSVLIECGTLAYWYTYMFEDPADD